MTGGLPVKKFLFALFAAALFLPGAIPAQAATWKLDKAHTNVKFHVKHLMVTNVWGRFDTFDGTVNYDPEKPSEASVDVTIDTKSVDTDNEKRDNHLRSADFFEAEKYPEMTFKSTRVVKTDNGLKVIGDLTIRGITHEIELLVEGPSQPISFRGSTKVAASATSTIDRTKWGLTWNRTLESGGVLVGDEVTIVIDAELDKVD